VTEQSSPHERLNTWRGTFAIAHETVFRVHRALVADERAGERSRALLAESAEIAVRKLDDLLTDARRLADRWDEQALLDPSQAAEALGAFDRELGRVEPRLRDLLGRERAIVQELRALRGDRS
jgi:hypothetical protein